VRDIKQKKYSNLKIWFSVSCLFLSIITLCGCQSYIANYSAAQKHFNMASQIRMNQMFEPVLGANAENAVIESNQIQTNYALALKLISEIIEKNKLALTNDQLLGNAYTIKALSEWKLGKTDKALVTQALAQKHMDQLFPRDKALMMALPGLIKADQANAKLLSGGDYVVIKDLIIGGNGAFNDFDNALKLVDEKHPVRFYFLMSKLAAIRIVQVATKSLDPDKSPDERRFLKQNYIDSLFNNFENELKQMKLYTEPSGKKLLNYWKYLLGKV
jgi:hypothetical protein